MPKPRVPMVAVAALAAIFLASCVQPADDVAALDMPRSQVWQTINDNLHAVDPAWVATAAPETPVRRSGCATNPNSWMPMGPPWRYAVFQWTVEPSPAYLDRVHKGLESLARQGFEVGPPPRVDDPRDRFAKDARGFTVDVRHVKASAAKPFEVTINANSPCVRHPGEVDDW